MPFWPFKRKRHEPARDVVEDFADNAPPPDIPLEPIGTVAELGDMPVWIDLEKSADKAVPVDQVIWDYEPLAEYYYHLAGDFERTKSGRPRYNKARIFAEVKVTFEDDAWALEGGRDPSQPNAYNHMEVWNYHARNAGWEAADYADGTVGQMLEAVRGFTSSQAIDRGIALAKGPAEDNLHERSVIVVPKDGWPEFLCSLQYIQIRPKGAPEQRNRVLEISLTCRDPDQPLAPLLSHYQALARRYQDMPWQALSGAIRV